MVHMPKDSTPAARTEEANPLPDTSKAYYAFADS